MPDVFYSNQIWIYTVDPEAEEPVMLINTHIGFDPDEGFGCMGDMFQRELLQLDALCIESNKKRIQVWINSPGGVVDDGMSIYSAILKSTTKVDTYCVGMAASIAGVIFQAGRQRIMADYSYLMYHLPYGSDDNKAMNAYIDMAVKMIAGRTKKTEEEVKAILAKTTWMGAEEAIEEGFADKIEASEDLNKRRAPADAFEAKAFYQESKKIVNQLFKNSVMPDNFPFSKIANKLGLHEQASADAIVDVLTGIMNKKSEYQKKCEDLEDEMTDTKRKMEDHKSELDDLKKKHEDLKKEHAEAKKKMEDEEKAKAEDKTKEEEKAKAKNEEEAKNAINQAAVEGRIPQDTDSIKMWTDLAVKDLPGTKAIIAKMPINRRAPVKITAQTTQAASDKVLTAQISNSMAGLRKKYLESNS